MLKVLMMSADEIATHIDELVEHDLGAAERLPVGLIIGRRAWNDSRGTVDNLTYEALTWRTIGLEHDHVGGPTVHLAARMVKPCIRSLQSWMKP